MDTGFTGSAIVRSLLARPDESLELIELQRRASLANSNYRAALLVAPDAIDVSTPRIEAGRVRSNPHI